LADHTLSSSRISSLSKHRPTPPDPKRKVGAQVVRKAPKRPPATPTGFLREFPRGPILPHWEQVRRIRCRSVLWSTDHPTAGDRVIDPHYIASRG